MEHKYHLFFKITIKTIKVGKNEKEKGCSPQELENKSIWLNLLFFDIETKYIEKGNKSK